MASVNKKQKRDSVKKDKLIITFDEEARREFLTGFRKRKNERRKKAQEDLARKEREKKIQIRAEKKERARKLLEDEEQRKRDLEKEMGLTENNEDDVGNVNAFYDHPDQTVTVTTVTDLDLAGDSSVYIGTNKADTEENVVATARTSTNTKGQSKNQKILKTKKHSQKHNSLQKNTAKRKKGFQHPGQKKLIKK